MTWFGGVKPPEAPARVGAGSAFVAGTEGRDVEGEALGASLGAMVNGCSAVTIARCS